MPDLEMLPAWAGRMAEVGPPPQPPLPPRRYANEQAEAPAYSNGHLPADNGSAPSGPVVTDQPEAEPAIGEIDEDGPPAWASTITSELPVVSIPFEDETYDDDAPTQPPPIDSALADDALIDDAYTDDAFMDTLEAPVSELVAWPEPDSTDGYESDAQIVDAEIVEAEIADEADAGTGVRFADDQQPLGSGPFGRSPIGTGLFEAEAAGPPTHPGLFDEIVYEPDEIELLVDTTDPIGIVPSSPPVSPVEDLAPTADVRKDPPRLADRTGGNRRLARLLSLLVVALVVVAAGVAAGYLFTSLSG